MPRSEFSKRRSATEWIVRGSLALLAGLAGFASVSQTLGYMLRSGDAERAHALAPSDGRVTAAWAKAHAGIKATPADRTKADRLARLALRQDPTSVTAASTLGINAQIRGEMVKARLILSYAERLSRRNLQTQLWAIEDSVGRGNIDLALRHYDIALRTSRNASDLLFPVLGGAITDPAIRVSLGRTLAARPSWGSSFIEYAAGGAADPRATARLLMTLRRTGTPVSELASAAVINTLIINRHPDAAWVYYAGVRPGVDRRVSRDPRFTAKLVHPSPFDWALINNAGISTSIQRGDRGGVVDFAAPPGVGGPLLQQMQALFPGSYRLQGHSSGIDQFEGSNPYWLLTCRSGRELGRVVVPNSLIADGTFTGWFNVPADCPVQLLVLVARPSDATIGSAGQIDHVRLSPAR